MGAMKTKNIGPLRQVPCIPSIGNISTIALSLRWPGCEILACCVAILCQDALNLMVVLARGLGKSSDKHRVCTRQVNLCAGRVCWTYHGAAACRWYVSLHPPGFEATYA